MLYKYASVVLTALPHVLAAPATEAQAEPPHPMITQRATLVDRTPTRVVERALTDVFGSLLNDLGSAIPSYVASGVPNFFQDFPTGSAVASTLGVSDDDLAALPTQVLNIPGYANWTYQGWNLRVHGNVYKKPNVPQSKIDDLANKFLIDTSVKDLPPSQANQARNLTAEIFVVQQGNQNVSFDLVDNYAVPPGLNGGLVAATGGAQRLTYPGVTTDQGDFDTFFPLQNTTGPSGGYLLPGNATTSIQALNIYTNGTNSGNASAYLVPTAGITIISDIDDILRVTKIYQPKEGLLNSFARPFTSWMNMPEVYANWSRTIPAFHFHYLTTTPEQITANYMEYIYANYPLGSFDTRPLNFSDVSATLSIRKFLLTKIFETFPRRKFILVGDTSNSDVMADYPALVAEFPNQVMCIWLRNTSSTDSGDKFPYDTSGFKGVNQQMYMFFNVPDDLKGLDIINGQCYNSSVRQDVTFGYQGLPLGINLGGGNDSNSTAGALRAGKETVLLSVGMACMAVLLGGLFSAL